MKTVVHIEDYKNALLTDSYTPKPWPFTFNSSLEVTVWIVWVEHVRIYILYGRQGVAFSAGVYFLPVWDFCYWFFYPPLGEGKLSPVCQI